jgi:cytochrome c oxidase assembly protein subunit 15
MLEDGPRLRDARYARRLAGASGALVALTWALIVLGALVRAHGAGLACPDWPLCFGEIVPRMNLEVGFEWAHRALAGSVAALFAGLTLLCWRRPVTRRATARLLLVGAALLASQILLGALTVWKLLAAWSVTSHLLAGNAFAATLLLVTLALRDAAAGRPRPTGAPARVRAWLALGGALLLLQLLLGGLVASRYAGLACPEWPTCAGGLWFPSWRGIVGLHLLHRWNALLLLAALLGAVLSARRTAGVRGPTAWVLGLAASQVLVGIANVRLGIPVEITALHSALGAGLVLGLVLALRSACRSESGARLAR